MKRWVYVTAILVLGLLGVIAVLLWNKRRPSSYEAPSRGDRNAAVSSEGLARIHTQDQPPKQSFTKTPTAKPEVGSPLIKLHMIDNRLRTRVIEILQRQGRAAAFDFLQSTILNDRNDELEKFFAIRLLPYVSLGDANIELKAVVLMEDLWNKPSSRTIKLAIMSAFAGLDLIPGYAKDASGIFELRLLSHLIDEEQLNRSPGGSAVYSWAFRHLPIAGQFFERIVLEGLQADDRFIRLSATTCVPICKSPSLENKIEGIARQDSSMSTRAGALSALVAMGSSLAASAVLSAAQTDESKLVRTRSLELVPKVIHDGDIGSQFLADRILSEKDPGVAWRAIGVFLEVSKDTSDAKLASEVERVFMGFVVGREDRLNDFLTLSGKTHDPRLRPIVTQGMNLAKTPPVVEAAQLALDRLDHADWYLGILRQIQVKEARLAELEASADSGDITQEMNKLESDRNRLRISYNSRFGTLDR